MLLVWKATHSGMHLVHVAEERIAAAGLTNVEIFCGFIDGTPCGSFSIVQSFLSNFIRTLV